MKYTFIAFLLFLCTKVVSQETQIKPVPFTSVRLNDCFFSPRINQNHEITIPIALQHCYNTGRVDNFLKAAGFKTGDFIGEFPFDDTDIYKIIEGASYSIQTFPDKEMESHLDALIFYITEAQEKDGYLFTNRTINPDKLHKWVGKQRWEKEMDASHELYNSGHLIEAAVAHYLATGKRTLLDVAIKNANLLVKSFGKDKLICYPGHQIIEMALVRLYSVTGNDEYLQLAKFFLDIRGNDANRTYSQSHKPIVEQDEAVGHAVRAAYMYSGMADVAANTHDQGYLTALDALWNDVVYKKLYITGGIGATRYEEAFGKAYELPNLTAYSETCASIGNVYWNQRMFLAHGKSCYYDVLERTLYNALMAGVSLDGSSFFYSNPLESDGNVERSKWFGCACCPSNICRFLPSIPGYIYATKANRLYVNLYIANDAEMAVDNCIVKIKQTTNYPWAGVIGITVNPETQGEFEIALRLPGWAIGKTVPSDLYHYYKDDGKEIIKLQVNGKPQTFRIENGYALIKRNWKEGDYVELNLPMTIRKISSNKNVSDNAGKIAFERGPLVYCLEETEQPDSISKLVITKKTDTALDDGMIDAMKFKTININATNGVYTAIPYCYWANRGKHKMKIWVPLNW